MCLGSPKSTLRYDNEHVLSPRPARSKRPTSKWPVSRHEIEHGTSLKKSKLRPKYVYGPGGGDIITVNLGEKNGKGKARNGRQIRGSAPSRSRYDDEHLIAPLSPADYCTPVELSYTHGMASSVSHYDDEHVIGTGRPLKDQRDPYVYGSRGQIIDRHEDDRHDNSAPSNQAELKSKVLASDSMVTRDDKLRLIRRDEKLREYLPMINHKEQPQKVKHCAKSTSRYDHKNFTGSTLSTLRKPEGLTEKDPLSTKDMRGASSSTFRYDEEHNMLAEPEHKTRMYGGAYALGMAKSISEYDDEHVIGSSFSGRGKGKALNKEDVMELIGSADSTLKHDDERIFPSKTVGGAGSGADAVLAVFSGESIHGGRAGDRKIGEKLDGRMYGPGSYLSSQTSSGEKREAEKKSVSRRPKEYGF